MTLNVAQIKIEQVINKAINTLGDLLESENEQIKLQAAQTILLLTQMTNENKQSATQLHLNMDMRSGGLYFGDAAQVDGDIIEGKEINKTEVNSET